MDHDELDRAMDGAVLAPADDGFDEARRIWNARLDARPDLIASCRDADDVAAAIAHARANDLAITVKGGGHSYAGKSAADGGVLIDLSGMDRIEVDPAARRVTVGPGATWAQVDEATQAHGLATTGATVSSVGVAGFTLGGGTGNLSRAQGFAADNLLAADVVTADGRQVRASDDQHPDLFWALRGAGANFGIVTSFELELHEVGPEVLTGQIIYPFDGAGEMLRTYRGVIADASDGMQCYAFMFRIPPVEPFPEEAHGEPALDFVVFHRDPEAIAAVQPLRDLGEPILDAVAPAPYTVAQQAFDANLPERQRYYTRAHDLAGVSDAVIDTITDHVPEMRGALTSAYFEPMGGAIARVDPGATAVGSRRAAAYSFHILAGWMEPSEDAAVMEWTRDFHAALAPHAMDSVYVNLLGEDEDDRVPAVYSDYDRLAELKTEWDPDNVFAANHNIAPTER